MRGPAVLLVALAMLAGCTGTPVSAPPPTSASPSPSAVRATAATAAPSTPPPAQCAAKVVAAMTPAERAGQLVMVGITDAGVGELAVLRNQRIGSVIIMGRHSGGVSAVRRLTSRLTWKGQHTPVLVAADQEGGLVQRLTGPGFATIPAAKVQATWSDRTLKSRAARWGRQLAAAGVNWTLAPVADLVPANMVDRNAPIGRLGRGYGSDPDVVADKVTAFVEGMQSSGIATSAKHFPGIGRVVGNTDFTDDVTDTVTTATDASLRPFRAAVEADGRSVMVSTVAYTRIDPDHPAVFSATVMNLLRDRIGFDGVVISDDLGAARSMASVPATKRAIGFVRAGGDVAITVAPALADEFVTGIVRAAEGSTAVAELVTAAATRVVALKVDLGLVPCR